MDGRLVADRIGFLGRARNRERLAAAPAPIDLTAFAGSTWLAHPFCSAECIEGRGVLPDLREALFLHVPEFEAGYGFGCMAGEHLAGRGYIERLTSPSAHASFGIAGIVIGNDSVDDDRML